jgi:hypothetical protein
MAFNGDISIGGNVSLGSSLFMGQTAKKEVTDTYRVKTDFKRILHPYLGYGIMFKLTSNKRKNAVFYLQNDLYLQNHTVENVWHAYDSSNALIHTKSTFYRMFEGGIGLETGFTTHHIVFGIGLNNIFTIKNYNRNYIYYNSNKYIYDKYDEKGVVESTSYYKLDITFKIGYQYLYKKAHLAIEPYFIYSIGAYHSYDPDYNLWGVFEAGRIDNFRFGVVITKQLKIKK